MLKKKKPEEFKYPFELKYTNKEGTACSKCAWYRFCPGCDIPSSDDIIGISLNDSDSVCLEWIIDRSDMFFFRTETKNWFEEDKSIDINREAQDTPLSFDQCMKWFTQKEFIGEEIFCPTCEGNKKTHKKMDLWKMPPILIVHLKRFQFYNNRWKKSNRLVEFPLENLRISDWFPKKKTKEEENDAVYDLFAIVNHYGNLGSGHYTAFAKHTPDNIWYTFDDHHFIPVKDVKDLISRSAYLLFYKRRDIDKNTYLESILIDKVTVSSEAEEKDKSNHKETSEEEDEKPSTCNLM